MNHASGRTKANPLAAILRASHATCLALAREPWMGRPVLWGIARRGIWHVTLHAGTVGRGIVKTFACGAASSMWGIETSTWFGMHHHEGRRLCRKCVRLLREAGEGGRIKHQSEKGTTP